ncbi:hypothetical protein TSL6_10540 [Sulfurovum sp. TSL6]|uniref:hypothetical protein n=1 Tax=Sulfurovum sp. TSL6 TaxID=2826995 RepID=UPI001CC69BC3|nr:hypothetical protein [Sulfurovum sp. TSL6]GIU00548.1 hypothetical protein TSL6_10540 [Sulfurovum sp. TSL6]
MAAPTKVEREKREKIKELDLFVRDSDIYTIFENETKDMSVFEASHVFNAECGYRDIHCNLYIFNTKKLNEIYNNISGLIKMLDRQTFQGFFDTYIERIKKLHSIDLEVFALYYNLIKHAKFLTFSNEKPFNYKIINLVYRHDFVNILGEERANALFGNYKTINIKQILPTNINTSTEYFDKDRQWVLTEEELELVRKFYFTVNQDEFRITPHSTLIKRDYITSSIPLYNNPYALSDNDENDFFIDYGVTKSTSTYVELDLTKPLDELKEYITKIKNDFEEDSTRILNIYDLLGDENNIFKCDFGECEIYKKDKRKPIGGRFADALFVYDCKKAGFDNAFIADEISRYWTDTKQLFPEKFESKTVGTYHKFVKEQIDNKKYQCYFSGYNITEK